jgi:hypothetical protein
MKSLLPLALSVVTLASQIFAPTTRAQERGVNLGTPAASSYHALVIGNNVYQQLPKLQTAEVDAKEVEQLLRENYGFRTKLLLNATRQQIVSALASYRRYLAAEDNLVVYYAGHGINDAEAGRAYWLPIDATRDDNSNWISADDITAATKTIPAKHVLIISDSCYSGSLTRGIGEMLPRPSEREQFLRKMMAGKSRTLMASGGNEPVADGGGGKHSVFAGALLQGLRTMDKEQFTAAELFRNFIEESVSGRANQTPEYNPLRNSGHESGDFIFVRSKAGAKNVEATGSAAPTAKFNDTALELAFWDTIKNSTDPADFKDYLDKYPNGQFTALARRRIAPRAPTTIPEAAPNPTKPDLGTIQNSVYTNDYFRLRVPVPAGWNVHDEESRRRIMQTGNEELSSAQPSMAQSLDKSLQRTLNLLAFDNLNLAPSNGGAAALIVGAEPIPPGQTMTTLQYMETTKRLVMGVAGYEMVQDIHTEMIGGAECGVMIVKRAMPGITMKQKYIGLVRKGYAIFLITAYTNEDAGRTLDDVLRRSKLN